MNSHAISSPATMTSKAGIDVSPVSSRSGANDQFGLEEKNRTFTAETVEEYNPQPWQDDRSTLRKLQDWWLFEVLGCLLSIGAACAIIFLLLYYDGQPLPSWPNKISLNSILALLTTVAKAGLMIPIGAAIGQLKWIWFAEKERPLADFQTFDEASRGPIGSLKLIGRLKGIHLACIGAVVSILGFGTSFITQQMIAYPTRLVSDRLNTSTSARSDLFYSYTQHTLNAGGYGVDFSFKAAAMAGLFHPNDILIAPIAPQCATGNCTWEPYRTLQICSKTANITDKLTYSDFTYYPGDVKNETALSLTASLPNNVSFGSGALNAMRMTYIKDEESPPANHSVAFLDLPNIMVTGIANLFVIYKDDKQLKYVQPHVPHSAIEIIFYWCVGEHITEVKNGFPSLNRIKTSTDVKATDGNIPDSLDITPDPTIPYMGEQPGALVLSGGKDKQENYTIDRISRDYVSYYLSRTMNGSTYNGFIDETSDGAEVMTSALYDAVKIRNVNQTMTSQQVKDLQLKTVDTLITNIATSLSNNIRSRPLRGAAAVGTAYIGQTYVEVRWPWLSYLLALLLLSFILLTGTIYKTKVSQVKIVKSSALAVMYGATDTLKGDLRHVDERQRIVQASEQSTAKFVNGGGVWRLTSAR